MNPGKAVIIGSGLAGLASGVLLAEHGWQVTVLEQHAIPGGLMQRYRRGDRWFDTGFHLATGSAPGSVLRAICRRLGILDRQVWLDPDPRAQFVVASSGIESLVLPLGLEATAAATQARFPEQAEALGRFFAVLRGRLAANPWLAGLVPGQAPVDLHDPEISVAGMLAWCGVSGAPATLLGAASSILAMRAEHCPFDMYAAFAGSTFAGGWRLAGGGEGFTRPLMNRLAALGGHVRLRRRAERIVHDGQQATAVVDATGEHHAADLVLSTVHPDVLRHLLGDVGLRPTFRARLEETPDSAGAFLIAAQLNRPATELGRSHHFLRLEDGGDAYLVAPDQWEPGLPPALEAMVWVPVDEVAAWRNSRLGRRDPAYEVWKQRQEERLMRAVAQRWPAVAASVTRRWLASPLTFRDYLGGRHGGSMGLSHDLGHLGSQPLSPRSKVRNVLFSGQNFSHPGILGTLIGACSTAGAVLGRDLRQECLG